MHPYYRYYRIYCYRIHQMNQDLQDTLPLEAQRSTVTLPKALGPALVIITKIDLPFCFSY